MQRRRLIVGNWKMHGTRATISELTQIGAAAAALPAIQVALCVPFTLIAGAAEAVPMLIIGAQDVHPLDKGAHTGAVSAPMLADAGARLVLVGHSECRGDAGSAHYDAQARIAAARRHTLSVILCCGETAAERARGDTEAVVRAQIEQAVPPDAASDWLTIAYEPRWAIGSGSIPVAEDIAAVHAAIRAVLAERIGSARSDAIRILYGGSVTAANMGMILSIPDVDGVLVGGASLTARDFIPIMQAAAHG